MVTSADPCLFVRLTKDIRTYVWIHVDDTSLLPDYPYRDDALLLWQATETYVKDYLSLYYTSDADVNEDTELQAWARKLMSSEGGGIKKLVSDGELDTLAKLVEVVTQIIFVAGPQHAAVNYPQYDYLAFSPNIPLAGYQSPPKAAEEVDIDYILRLLPPQAQEGHHELPCQALRGVEQPETINDTFLCACKASRRWADSD